MARDSYIVRKTYYFCQGAWHPTKLESLRENELGETIKLRFQSGPAKGKLVTTGDASLIARDPKGERRYKRGREIVA